MVIVGTADDRTQQQLQTCLDGEPGSVGALMADNHLGYSMPIGGVVGYEKHVSPSGVGYDIACGNMAIKTDAFVSDLDMRRIMDDVWKFVAFGVGRKNNDPVDHPVLERIAQDGVPFQRGLAQMAAQQLGTVGSGNHYVDVFADEDGYAWIGVHFGSRGFGHKTATWALTEAGSRGDDMMAPPTLIPIDSYLGEAYIHAMTIAGEYAYAGREIVVEIVRNIIGAHETFRVHNHHNFAWHESIGGRMLWVHRKGATPAYPGQLGFIGSTMMEESVIVRGNVALDGLLYSTVHGAGRAMSRRQAAGKTKTTMRWVCRDIRKCDFSAPRGGFQKVENGPTPVCPSCGHKLRLQPVTKQVSPGAVDWARVTEEMQLKGIELRGAGADEAPDAYKRLGPVLAAHGDSIEVLHRLRPVGVAMAGSETFDPYKD